MASTSTLPITLGAIPKSYSPSTSQGKISAPSSHSIFPAGPSFIRSTVRTQLQRSFEEDDKVYADHAAALAAKGNGEEVLGPDFDGLGEEDEEKAVLESDPKEWKRQDHYAILGLGHLRYKANDDHIRVAHRRKVLRHHPDKKANSGDANNDSFFKCIQKAHETLTSQERRRQYDSADDAIDDIYPNPATVKPENFITAFAPVFELEGRFSKKQPVPALGTNESSKKEVESFYDFWYNFDSWRSFEWHDKEVNEGSDSRDDKRFTEKKNKSERQRRKVDDNKRVRELVDSILAVDPRIKRIRAEEKAARDLKKRGGKPCAAPVDPKAAKAAEEAKKAEEAKAAAEAKKAEEENKVASAANKKAREAAKKNRNKYKKAIATAVSSLNYFLPAGTAPSASVIESTLNELDAIVAALEPEDVKTLKEDVEKVSTDGPKVKETIKAAGAKASGAKLDVFA